MNMNTEWTADDIRAILTSPVCTGMGRYQAIVEDDLWLDANMRRVEEEGAAIVIESALEQFEEAFAGLLVPNAGSYIQQAKTNPRVALRRLLVDLRQLAPQMTGEMENAH